MSARRSDAGSDGMTLLELMVVAAILATLLGLGIGFLRRGDGMSEARSALVGQLRLAALDARSRGLPTEVVITPGAVGQPAEVAARGLVPALLVTFEPGQNFATTGLSVSIGGDAEPNGRCGAARVPADKGPPAVRVPMGPDQVDLREGFALRVDVRLVRRGPGRLCKLGRAIDVGLDEQARPYARFLAGSVEGRAGAAINLKATTGLPVGRWCTLELGADGHRAWCGIDGRTVAQQDFKDELLQAKEDVFELGPGDQPIPGAVDEVQLFAYAWSPAVRLPDAVAIDKTLRIAFDALGEPIAPPEIKLEVIQDNRTDVLHVGPGGVLQ